MNHSNFIVFHLKGVTFSSLCCLDSLANLPVVVVAAAAGEAAVVEPTPAFLPAGRQWLPAAAENAVGQG